MKYIYIILLSCSFIYSQEFEPADFFPFHVGDVWEYDTGYPKRDIREITKDSVSTEGHYLFYNNGSNPRYLVDSIFVTKNPNANMLGRFKIYKLDTDSGETWVSWEDTSTGRRALGTVTDAFLTYIFGQVALVKKIEHIDQAYEDSLWIEGWTLYTHYIGSGFGLIREDGDLSIEFLISGAKIDGVVYGELTSIGHPKDILPAQMVLHPNYPNPFNPSTTIKVELIKYSNIEVGVINILGQTIAILADGNYSAGVHEFKFEAANLASGTYFYYIKAGDKLLQRKMKYLK